MQTARTLIEFLQTIPPDAPLWADVVTAEDVRNQISESLDYSGERLPTDEEIALGMKRYERSIYFTDEIASVEITGEVVRLMAERKAATP